MISYLSVTYYTVQDIAGKANPEDAVDLMECFSFHEKVMMLSLSAGAWIGFKPSNRLTMP
jgi:hypothetical protein